jgi:hypothetical protein
LVAGSANDVQQVVQAEIGGGITHDREVDRGGAGCIEAIGAGAGAAGGIQLRGSSTNTKEVTVLLGVASSTAVPNVVSDGICAAIDRLGDFVAGVAALEVVKPGVVARKSDAAG